VGPFTKQVVKKVNDPHGSRGRECERDMARVRVGHGMTSKNYCVVGGCLLFSNWAILYILAYEDKTECSETSEYKIQTPGNYPE
jgi:hypothetical protein